MVRNHCLTLLRDKQRQDRRMEGFEVEEAEESFVYQMIEAEIYALINDIFEELPEACRNVYAKSLEGKSHKEIAEELNIAVTTIKKHKTNANNYLRERLKHLLCFMMYLYS